MGQRATRSTPPARRAEYPTSYEDVARSYPMREVEHAAPPTAPTTITPKYEDRGLWAQSGHIGPILAEHLRGLRRCSSAQPMPGDLARSVTSTWQAGKVRETVNPPTGQPRDCHHGIQGEPQDYACARRGDRARLVVSRSDGATTRPRSGDPSGTTSAPSQQRFRMRLGHRERPSPKCR